MRVSITAYGGVLSLLLLSASPVFSQQFLSGRIHKKSSTEVLMSVSVHNLTQRKYNQSDMGGNFKIGAMKGDTVVFTSAGYLPDTTIVNTWMFEEADGYTVYLKPNLVELPSVRVGEQSNYQLDSLKRRDDYRQLEDSLHKVKLAFGKTFSDGVGISFSPLSYFYGPEARRRRFRKRLKQEEIDYYIDSRFPRPYVARVTGLQGDSLQVFMFRYRPSYKFCRQASNEDMLFYINDCLKKYHGARRPGGASR
ncbi:MAG TPA: hypothetical protein VF939_25315 [Puia sp.]